ncbi:MAG: hypothetical protein J7M34_12590 [Anaerolineae bacterium]|nr:hypothetical protein [Anaerolineae bacterium]
MSFPTTHIEDLEISRLICGTNGFLGFSHFSAARDRWMREYFTVERIAEVISRFAELGINAVMAPLDDKLIAALDEVERHTGQRMIYIATPGGHTVDEVIEGVRRSAEVGARICMPHQMYTDTHLLPAETRIEGIEPILEEIRRLGMIPGLSTHRPETIIVGDKAGYDIATYIQPYNAIGFLCQVETDWIGQVIRNTPKPVMCIKPLGAGRILPPTGLNFVFNTCKPTDMVTIGTISVYEAEEDVQIALEILTGQNAKRDLTFSRSKSIFVDDSQ